LLQCGHKNSLFRRQINRDYTLSHKEGSRTFARYRVTDVVAEANAKEIDEDMKRDLVSMLE
jgi:hypothetical protein